MATPTVLILGAGASSDFEFPLGKGLLNSVCALCETRSPSLLEQGFTEEDVVTFGESLSRSGYTSVDWFLEEHPQFLELGRVAVAAALIPYEKPDKLFPPQARSDHWYEDLVNTFWSDDDGSLVLGNHITILTFNYDRSLEYYLRTVVETRRSLKPSTQLGVTGPDRVIVSQGPTIVYLHGRLGHLDQSARHRDYSPDTSKDRVRLAAAGLKLISEADGNALAFTMARDAIRGAERTFFLGFGFHPKSVERLADFSDDTLIGPIRWGSLIFTPER